MVTKKEPKTIALFGVTASGKSQLALELCKSIEAEIISVDSTLIYKGMDIGTAKPSEKDQLITKHHLIDVIEPFETYSVANFLSDTKELIKKIHQRGKTVILCGGTMLYFNTLYKGLSNLPATNSDYRKMLDQQWQQDPSQLYQLLQSVDPISAQKLHFNDQQRIFRALEVYEKHKIPLSKYHQLTPAKPTVKIDLSIALIAEDRVTLHQQIQKRFHHMLNNGLLNEVKQFHQNPKINAQLPSMLAIGYKQLWQYFNKELTLDESIEKSIIATRQLAKRQMTWINSLKKQHPVHSINHQQENYLSSVLKLIENE